MKLQMLRHLAREHTIAVARHRSACAFAFVLMSSCTHPVSPATPSDPVAPVASSDPVSSVAPTDPRRQPRDLLQVHLILEQLGRNNRVQLIRK
jgi:hypothetical protein